MFVICQCPRIGLYPTFRSPKSELRIHTNNPTYLAYESLQASCIMTEKAAAKIKGARQGGLSFAS
jgi:hypothetical protein